MFRYLFIMLSSLMFSCDAHADDLPEIDFSLRDIYGDRVSLSDYRSKKVVINFWATWCEPCIVEMKEINEIIETGEKDFTFISINVDEARDISKIKPFVKRNGYTFKVLLDTNKELLNQVSPNGVIPYSIIINGNGKIAWSHSGYHKGIGLVIKKIIKNMR